MARRKGFRSMAGSSSTKPAGMTSTQAVSRVKRLYQAAKQDMPARSIRSRPASSDRLRRGNQDRPSRSRAARSTGSRSASAPRLTPTTPRERAQSFRGRPAPRSRRGFPISPATSSRCRRAIPRSRSMAPAPTTSPATRRFERRGACRSPGSGSAYPDKDRAVLEARCGKGTYVRALARDLAASLLRPCRSLAPDQSRSLRRGQRGDARCARSACRTGSRCARALQPVETALADIPALAVSGPDADRLRRGQPVLLRGRDPVVEGTVYATSRGTLIALGEVERGELHPKRIFNLPMRPSGVRLARQ